MYSCVGRLCGRAFPRVKPNTIFSIRKQYKADHAANLSKAVKDVETISSPSLKGQQPLGLMQRLGPLTKAFDIYGRTQNKRPYATQLGTSVVIYFCGDLGAQKIGGEAYDPWRTTRSMAIGAVVSIPAYKWYFDPFCLCCVTNIGSGLYT